MKRLAVRCRGFSLLELLVAVCIVTIIGSWAGPAMSTMVGSAQVHSGALVLANSLMLARNEAVKRNQTVVMCKAGVQAQCTREGGWEQGWILFSDPNNNAWLDEGEEVFHREGALASGLALAGNAPVSAYVSYTPYGRTRLVTGAFQAGTFTVCKSVAGRVDARQVIINNAGRPRTTKVTLDRCRAAPASA